MRTTANIKQWVVGYDDASAAMDDLNVLAEFIEAGDDSQDEYDMQYAIALSKIEDLEFKNMLRNEEDSFDAILKINAGAGGTEANDWAQMLMRMYARWAEDRKFKVTTTNLLEGEEAGI